MDNKQDHLDETDVELYGDPGIASKNAKIPTWLIFSNWFWVVVGLVGFYLYWNGSYGWLDRGYWSQLQRAANTAYPYTTMEILEADQKEIQMNRALNALKTDAKMEIAETEKEIQMNQKNIPIPQYLYKIVSPEDWQESLLKNQVVTSPVDKDFIHLATENQLTHVAQKFWKGKSYIILKLDAEKMRGRLIYETNPGGTDQYFHLYEGRIPLDAVVDTSIINN